MRTFLSCLLIVSFALTSAAVTGCGGSGESTVIEPGEAYQKTPEEQALKDELDRQRAEMGDGPRQ